eukprot:Gregarina_sp_Poly_1__4865@NODE_258_length_10499_cov_54_071223_g225_i0_p1_GENE_NODE_258_length_10499_cov_54_071223_g225_i0NODE_258_length_10499_cov_54_071223_g225_i0_p1_ORF_typecomplete_len1304_score223_76FbpA/PF05833_11/9_7e81FbpA/PF05833_11/1_6e04NFACTR_1/PF05670_13/1_7e03NFACTR_1/PF05670_13/5_8e26NFACTR_1/PF05670_13/3_6e03NFACTC/PF11923_8/6_5e02NFACTC/PF11923_8/7_9e03NFACTC/PF11923_8/1_6e20_NODE_258_length_10499_cov_54_071223_g225_i02384149
MPKSRMTALDVRAMVTDIKPLCLRLRVANVYDISSKVYVLKLSEGEVKRHLVLQSGTRFHLSNWKRDKQSVPSYFTMRLRKSIRTKRLTNIEQLGFDRVIDITLGHGDLACHLLVEFYATGNVILTDHEYIVKSSWRQFKSEDALAVRLNERYPVDEYRRERCVIPSIDVYLKNEKQADILAALNETLQKEKQSLVESMSLPLKGKEKKAKQTCLDLNSVLLADVVGQMCSVAHKALIEHIMLTEGLDVQTRISLDNAEPLLYCVIQIMRGLLAAWASVSTSEQRTELTSQVIGDEEPVPKVVKGYLLVVNGTYEDFSPLPLANKDYRDMNTFHECVDEYYSSVEVLKAEKAKSEKLLDLESKIEKIRNDQNERVATLQAERDACEKQAICVEYHIDFVSRALEMMQRMLQSGSDWSLIEKLIKEKRRNNHPICAYIQSVDFNRGKFTLLLQDTIYGHHNIDDNETEIAEDAPLISVPLVINDSAFQNVKNLHDAKKLSQAKFVKTEIAARRVIAQAEQAAAKVKKTKELTTEPRPQIRKLRKTFWFERFYWFVSSDKFLVLGGHDATENEILYKKYLRKEDLFVHADVHGAATCIIRNGPRGKVPQSTIDEAGIFSVCRSNAWKTKVLMSAYWVYAHQVSKTPQTGEYIATGGFIIRGQRNPIIVKKLEMGLGVFFHLGDEESIKRHLRGQEENATPGPEEAQRAHSSHMESTDSKNYVTLSSSADLGVEGSNSEVESSSGEVDQLSEMEKISKSVGALTPRREQSVSPPFIERAQSEIRPLMGKTGGSSSSRVQFGQSEILPTPAIQQRVEFDELPPEVIVVHSERSILSDDENHWLLRGDSADEETGEEEEHFKPVTGTISSKKLTGDLCRPDSADELPPPSSYLGRAAPRDLLAKRTPETAPMAQESDTERELFGEPGLFADRAQTERQEHRTSLTLVSPFQETLPTQSKSLPSRRKQRSAVDGGPPPRGFLEFEVPPVRDLLRFGSRHSGRDIFSEKAVKKEESNATQLSRSGVPKEDDILSKFNAETETADNDTGPKTTKKHMSKAERKLRKSKQKEICSEKDSKVDLEECNQRYEENSPRAEKKVRGTAQLPRGKKLKMKRIKKYQDQSDDEKEMALKLIGSKRMKHEVPESHEISASSSKPELDVWTKSDKLHTAVPDRNIAEESENEIENEQWQKRLELLNELTGQPIKEDTILSAIPTCAPYPAIKNFTYKGRVLPGGGKKGQAIKHALQAFVEMSPEGSIERELIRQISVDELSACLVSNPFVQIQGIEQFVRAEKKVKKLEKQIGQQSACK